MLFYYVIIGWNSEPSYVLPLPSLIHGFYKLVHLAHTNFLCIPQRPLSYMRRMYMYIGALHNVLLRTHLIMPGTRALVEVVSSVELRSPKRAFLPRWIAISSRFFWKCPPSQTRLACSLFPPLIQHHGCLPLLQRVLVSISTLPNFSVMSLDGSAYHWWLNCMEPGERRLWSLSPN